MNAKLSLVLATMTFGVACGGLTEEGSAGRSSEDPPTATGGGSTRHPTPGEPPRASSGSSGLVQTGRESSSSGITDNPCDSTGVTHCPVDPNGGGTSGSGGTSSGGTSGTGGATCCPRDAEPAGCMQLGGTSADGTCGVTCDFWCSENWRVVLDPNGCDTWVFDRREPAADEDSFCRPAAIDGGSAPVP